MQDRERKTPERHDNEPQAAVEQAHGVVERLQRTLGGTARFKHSTDLAPSTDDVWEAERP